MIRNFTTPHAEVVEFDPFAGPEIAYIAPVTEPQMEVWTACLIGGDDANRAYNILVSLQLKGALDRPAMEQSIQALVHRHESLRSVFSANGEYLCVFKEVTVDITYQDISEKTDAEKELRLADYLKQSALHVVDLLNGPLFKVALFRVADQDHRLVLMAHHSIMDGWSMGIVLQDLSILYSAYEQGISPALAEAPSFVRYAEDQRRFSESDEYAQQEKFWIDQYNRSGSPFDLPTDFPRPSTRTFTSKRLDYTLDDDLILKVKKMGIKAGCSFVTTLLAAFEVLLHRQSGQESIVVGLPTAGQSVTDNNRLVGHCVNLLPLRSHLRPQLKFADFLTVCRQSVFDAYDHQRLTFSNLLKKINIPRDPSRVPLVPVIFNIDMGMDDGVDFHNLTHQLITHPKAYEHFEWFFNISEAEKTLTVEWAYNPQLFKSETIDRLMSDFKTILNTVVADPSILIGDIKFESEHGLSDKLTQWNNTTAAYPRHTPVHKLIEQTAATSPTKTALRFNKQDLSYQQLNETANQLAHYLIQKEIRAGDVVGIALDRSPEMLIALLAVLKAGAAYLPLDPDYPQDRITFMLADSSARLLITSRNQREAINSQTDQVLIEDALAASAHYPKTAVDVSVSGNDLAYVLYTSGSTGKPKGVLIEQYNLVNFLWSMRSVPGIGRDDILLAVTTISFDISGLELYLPLLAGATILLADTPTARDGRALLDLIRTEKASIMQATPSTWQMMLNAGWDSHLPLKALCGGEALPKDLATKLMGKCSELWNVYGPTETTIWSTVKQITHPDDITIGRPIHNTQVYILDEFFKPVPQGVVGELYIAGDGVARGYLNRPELTREKFVKNPFDRQQKGLMYRTGDLGKFLQDGEIQCLGRVDQQVKIRGHRIEPGEIEYVLSTGTNITEAVVITREDRPGNQRLVAYVVSQMALSAEQVNEWKQHIRQKLPAYMVPDDFVALPKLPLTPNGKLDRKALPEPQLAGTESKPDYVGPRTDVEKLVADIWIDCLKLEKVSVFDNFFELGGHSLIAVQVMAQLEKKTGKNMPLATLFECPTVEKLALVLDMDGWSVTWDALVPIKPQGTKMPIYIIHGSGLHVLLFNVLAIHMDPDQPIYGLQAKGINSTDEPYDNIEEMAAYYIDAILKKNPEGPYALAGYSFGGLIAYEVSKQLLERGKKVKLLAMFDTYADQSYYHHSWPVRVWHSTISLLKDRLYVLTLLKDNPLETLSFKAKSMKRKLYRLYRKTRYSENDLRVFNDNYYKVQKTNQTAARKYCLVPISMHIDVFRAKKRSYYMDDFEFLGWKPFALKGVNIHEIPGDHFSLFSSPNDKEFARVLQKVLNDC